MYAGSLPTLPQILSASETLTDVYDYASTRAQSVLAIRQGPTVHPDSQLLERLEALRATGGTTRVTFVEGALMREHFRSLTASVLRPFERYCRTHAVPQPHHVPSRRGSGLLRRKERPKTPTWHTDRPSPDALERGGLFRGAQWIGVYADPEALLERFDETLFIEHIRRTSGALPQVCCFGSAE
jgi:hypothetical protein